MSSNWGWGVGAVRALQLEVFCKRIHSWRYKVRLLPKSQRARMLQLHACTQKKLLARLFIMQGDQIGTKINFVFNAHDLSTITFGGVPGWSGFDQTQNRTT